MEQHDSDNAFPTVAAPAQATPSLLPPLTSALVVLRREGACAQVGVLPHVVAATSDLLDYGLPQFWSLPRACEANLLSLLPRLASCEISNGVDPYFWRCQCRLGLVSAVKHDNLVMAELLHEYCPIVLPYLAMIEAAKTGNLHLLEWLSERHEGIVWLLHMMDAAASTGQLQILQWLFEHPKNVGCTSDAFGFAVQGGYVDTVKWLLDHYPNAAAIFWDEVSDVRYSAFCDVVRLLFEDPWPFPVQLVNGTIWFAEKGDLKMVQ